MFQVVFEVMGGVFCVAGALFFVAGSIGLVRFPDVYTRLHALTKADSLGLGLISVGVTLQTDSWWIGLKIILIWMLALLAAAATSCLIASAARRNGIQPWGTR
jgi:multicomponent Na+:H+ antiporter subunit G